MTNLTSLQVLAVTIMLLFGASNCHAGDKPWGMSDYDYGYAQGYKSGIKQSEHKKEELLWEKDVNLNDILSKHPELRLPIIEGEQNFLAFSEFCPYCGGFSFWHRIQNNKRTCCRCYHVWERPNGEGGNYYCAKELFND